MSMTHSCLLKVPRLNQNTQLGISICIRQWELSRSELWEHGFFPVRTKMKGKTLPQTLRAGDWRRSICPCRDKYVPVRHIVFLLYLKLKVGLLKLIFLVIIFTCLLLVNVTTYKKLFLS
jgi:hypothetical protein